MPPSPSTKKALAAFGAALRKRRREQMMTQTELGSRVGVSSKTLCNVEMGVNWLSLPVYVAICRELKTIKPPLL